MPKLTEDELTTLLAEAPEWRYKQGGLERDFAFPDFAEALAFVNRIGLIAEEVDHHPDIDIRYNRVTLGLVSHDVGGLTERDARMVRRIGRECV